MLHAPPTAFCGPGYIVDPQHPWPALPPSPHCSPVQNLVDPLSSVARTTCPANCSLLDLITLVIKGWPVRFRILRLLRSRGWPVTGSHTGPRIVRRTRFSNTRSLLRSRSVRLQDSQPYRTIGRRTAFQMRSFVFRDSSRLTSRTTKPLHKSCGYTSRTGL